MPTILAAPRHNDDAGGSRSGGCARPSCSPPASTRPRSPASTDMAGLNRGRVPRFVKRYADLGGVLADAAVRFPADVWAGVYPDEEHSYN